MQIKCLSCGKIYDYNKNEICPRCGAYTSPSDRQKQQMKLERQLLNERMRNEKTDCTPECVPLGFGGHRDISRNHAAHGHHQGSQVRQETATARRREMYAPRYDAQREYREEKRGNKLGLLPIVFIVLAVIVLLNLLPWGLEKAVHTYRAQNCMVENLETTNYAMGQTVQTGGVCVTVDDWGYVDSALIGLSLPEHLAMVGVHVIIDQADADAQLLQDNDVFYLSDGDRYRYPLPWDTTLMDDTDGINAAINLLTENELYQLELWEAAYGSTDGWLFFLVDSAGPYSLCIQETTPLPLDSFVVSSVHEILLDDSMWGGAAA